MLFKVSPASKNSVEQDRCVYGRDFGIPSSLAVIQVSEMKKKASMSRHLFPEEAQGEQNPVSRRGRGNESALFSDTKSSHPKPCRSNPGDNRCVILQNITSIYNQPS